MRMVLDGSMMGQRWVNAPNGAGFMTSGWRRSVTFNPLLTLCMPLGTIDRLTSKPDVFSFRCGAVLEDCRLTAWPGDWQPGKIDCLSVEQRLDGVFVLSLYSVLVSHLLAPKPTAEDRF